MVLPLLRPPGVLLKGISGSTSRGVALHGLLRQLSHIDQARLPLDTHAGGAPGIAFEAHL